MQMSLSEYLARRKRPLVPYAQRPTNELLFAAKLLHQRDLAIPTDLAAALNQRGIEASSI